MSVVSVIFRIAGSILVLLLYAWGTVALVIAGPPGGPGLVLAGLFVLCLPLMMLTSRSFSRGLLVSLVPALAVLVWWHTLAPTNDKDWAPEVARLPHGQFSGNLLTLHNVRAFRYQSEERFTQQWLTQTYDLDQLEGLDLFLSHWGSDHIAHVILSWDFGDRQLAISIETRKDKTQEYSAVKGFFKQYELIYVAADEEDIIKLRTNFRKERVYRYRVKARKEMVIALLLDYLEEMNRLLEEPHFYNALTRNCTVTIDLHVKAIDPDAYVPPDWRLILSGHVAELMYDRQALETFGLPYPELRERSRIDEKMRLYKGDDFSGYLRTITDLHNPEHAAGKR